MKQVKAFISLKSAVSRFYDSRAKDGEERLRLTAFLMSTLLTLLSMPLHFTGTVGMTNVWLDAITLLFMATLLLALVVYLARKISLSAVFTAACVIGQVLQSAGMIVMAVLIPDATFEAMTINAVISYAILIYLTLGFLTRGAVVVTVLDICSMTFVALYNPSAHLLSLQMWMLFVIAEASTCILAIIAHKSIHTMQRETNEYKGVQEQMLHAFGVTKDELLSLLMMTKTKDAGDITKFFRHLNVRTRRSIIKGAINYNDKLLSQRKDIAEVFPTLSETELAVSRLIIEGKTKKEIAEILEKTESNVGTVRINIRKKLGLVSGQDLRECLKKRLDKGTKL